MSEIVSIYPNPVKDELTINTGDQQIQNIEIFNVLGKIVYFSKLNNHHEVLNLSFLNSGNYFVQITIDNTIKTFKIIKD